MGRKQTLTPDLKEAVLAKTAGGMSAERCAQWLHATHGIKLTGRSIRAVVRARRSELADSAKTVVRQHFEKSLPDDLALLDRDIQLINHIVVRAMNSENPELVIRALAERRKIVDTKLHYAGVDQPDDTIVGTLSEFLGGAFARPADTSRDRNRRRKAA